MEYGVGWIQVKRDLPQMRAPLATGAASGGEGAAFAENAALDAAGASEAEALADDVGPADRGTCVPVGATGSGGEASVQAPADSTPAIATA